MELPERKIFTVSELTGRITDLLEQKFPSVWIQGEISNFRAAPSGHVYFTLKDDLAQIRARGYGTDREESEPGINCLALPLFLTSESRPDGAISVTAIAQRVPLERLVAAVDEARSIIRDKLGEVTR